MSIPDTSAPCSAFTIAKRCFSRIFNNPRQFAPMFLLAALNWGLCLLVCEVLERAVSHFSTTRVLILVCSVPLFVLLFVAQLTAGSAAASGMSWPADKGWVWGRVAHMVVCCVSTYLRAAWSVIKWSVPITFLVAFVCGLGQVSDETSNVLIDVVAGIFSLWGSSRVGWLLFAPAFVVRGYTSEDAVAQAQQVGGSVSGWSYKIVLWLRVSLVACVVGAAILAGAIGTGAALFVALMALSLWFIPMSVAPMVALQAMEEQNSPGPEVAAQAA